jgi:phosphoribosylanthranilate isomerase
MSRKELLEFAQTVHEENVKLSKRCVQLERIAESAAYEAAMSVSSEQIEKIKQMDKVTALSINHHIHQFKRYIKSVAITAVQQQLRKEQEK